MRLEKMVVAEREIKDTYHKQCQEYEKKYNEACAEHKLCGTSILGLVLLRGLNERKIVSQQKEL